MTNRSWVELSEKCPLDVERIKSYADLVDSTLPERIRIETINGAKGNVLKARGYLDSMFNALIQMIYDNNILKKSEDKVVFMWLTEDIARYLGRLDEAENNLIIKFDSPDAKEDRVGISRISSYSKKIEASCEIVYSCLMKSTEEYNLIKGEEKNERSFLYILFQVLMVTMAVSGGLQRSQGGKLTKRSAISMFPTNYQTLMSENGSKIIKKGFEEDTGIDMSQLEETLEGLYD